MLPTLSFQNVGLRWSLARQKGNRKLETLTEFFETWKFLHWYFFFMWFKYISESTNDFKKQIIFRVIRMWRGNYLQSQINVESWYSAESIKPASTTTTLREDFWLLVHILEREKNAIFLYFTITFFLKMESLHLSAIYSFILLGYTYVTFGRIINYFHLYINTKVVPQITNILCICYSILWINLFQDYNI